MGELFRSRDMSLIHIYMHLDAAHETLLELGKFGFVQFRDLTPGTNAFQRNFVNEIKRIEELIRKYKIFELEVRKLKTSEPLLMEQINQEEKIETSLQTINQLEQYFESVDDELKQLNSNQIVLEQNFCELTELQYVLQCADKLFEDILEEEMLNQIEDGTSGFITGTIEREKVNLLEKILWRITRGNSLFKHTEIEEPIVNPKNSELLDYKNVFTVYFQGDVLRNKITKLCESMHSTLYPCPLSLNERTQQLDQIATHISDLTSVKEKSKSHKIKLLMDLLRYGDFWYQLLVKEKAIYHTMNLCEYDIGRRCLIAEGWCPTEYLTQIQNCLTIAKENSGVEIPSILTVDETEITAPTYNKTNEFTSSFQDIVDMYGVARYKEVNPALYTVITFPFLFGVMFGDIGHGWILLLVALALILLPRFKFNLSTQIKQGRWLILLMSLFSIYCGFMYNEFFGLPTCFFPATWTYFPNGTDFIYSNATTVRVDPDYIYPFGVDPMWKGSKNELDYYNSLKMKMSIIFGVVQMTFGIGLSFLNHWHLKEKKNIFCEFIPQVLFLQSIFGYMCFLILLKWTINWEDASKAPRILNLLTAMLLSPWSLEDKFYIFPGQHAVQIILLITAFVTVPWMLFAKPIVILISQKLKRKKYVVTNEIEMTILDDQHPIDDEFETPPHHPLENEHEEEISELFIHQGIHTIEFVLGCVSNTASYLRLWALSLAHSELSAVFWERIMLAGLGSANAIFIVAAWSVWAALTVGVLLGMESMSAFLHALRLHWVEFQNKFYKADGYKFTPFSFQVILESEENQLL